MFYFFIFVFNVLLLNLIELFSGDALAVRIEALVYGACPGP